MTSDSSVQKIGDPLGRRTVLNAGNWEVWRMQALRFSDIFGEKSEPQAVQRIRWKPLFRRGNVQYISRVLKAKMCVSDNEHVTCVGDNRVLWKVHFTSSRILWLIRQYTGTRVTYCLLFYWCSQQLYGYIPAYVMSKNRFQRSITISV